MAICRTKREAAFDVSSRCSVAGKTLSRIVYRWVVNESYRITREVLDNDRYMTPRVLRAVFVGLFVNNSRY